MFSYPKIIACERKTCTQEREQESDDAGGESSPASDMYCVDPSFKFTRTGCFGIFVCLDNLTVIRIVCVTVGCFLIARLLQADAGCIWSNRDLPVV